MCNCEDRPCCGCDLEEDHYASGDPYEFDDYGDDRPDYGDDDNVVEPADSDDADTDAGHEDRHLDMMYEDQYDIGDVREPDEYPDW